MDLKNCPYCGKVFLQRSSAVSACDECTDRYKAEFNKVKEQIRLNPGISVQETSERTGVPVPTILAWIREGHIQFNR